MPKNDGGSAFPTMHDPRTHPSGMTLRDWFAGQALAGFVANRDFHGAGFQGSHALAADYAYKIADAMLAARGESDAYHAWVMDFENGSDGPHTYEWDVGIAP